MFFFLIPLVLAQSATASGAGIMHQQTHHQCARKKVYASKCTEDVKGK